MPSFAQNLQARVFSNRVFTLCYHIQRLAYLSLHAKSAIITMIAFISIEGNVFDNFVSPSIALKIVVS